MLAAAPDSTFAAAPAAALLAALLAGASPAFAADDAEGLDAFAVSLSPSIRESLRGDERGGVLLVLLLPETRSPDERPADGPWWGRPHPFASRTIDRLGDLAANASPLELSSADPAVRFYPAPPETLEGTYRMQAVLRPFAALPAAAAAASDAAAPAGEMQSEIRLEALAADATERIELMIDSMRSSREGLPEDLRRSRPDSPPAMLEVLRPSPRLAAEGAWPPRHRAWVVFPRRYHDLDAPRRIWPAVLVIPSGGDGEAEARSLAEAIALPAAASSMPQAVWIVLDPSSAWGHHGFADGPLQGSRGTALVEEFLPHLERRFRIDPRREARLLWGHGPGGWSALWLLAQHADTFEAAFATSPEAIDHRAIAGVDLSAASAFDDPAGDLRPAYREPIGAAGGVIRATVAQEARMADAADPSGRSGNRWHRLAARMSPPGDPPTRPRPLFDPRDGVIDPEVAAAWRRYDLAAATVRDPQRLVPLWRRRAMILCGGRDEFLHDLGVRSFATMLAEEAAAVGAGPPGNSIAIVPEATFDSIVPAARFGIYRSMIERLRAAGLHD